MENKDKEYGLLTDIINGIIFFIMIAIIIMAICYLG